MNRMPRLLALLLSLACGSVPAEDADPPRPPVEPETVPVEPSAAGAVNGEVVDRLERIEQSLRNLEQSLQNVPPEQPAPESAMPDTALSPTMPESPDVASVVADNTSPPDSDLPPGFRLGHWFITVLEACFGLGIALMSVALGLILGRRQSTTRLTLKIAVNGQRRESVNDDTVCTPEEKRLLNAPPPTEPFLQAADYGLVDLRSTEPPSEGRFTVRPDGMAIPVTESVREETREEPCPEKTIDEILRELTGQPASFPGVDALSILDQASGDYSRDPAIAHAMMPEASVAKNTPIRTPLDTDFADITDRDEIETQLDLARAYVEMGELDTARELLLEVEALGTRSQQGEARRWLAQCQTTVMPQAMHRQSGPEAYP